MRYPANRGKFCLAAALMLAVATPVAGERLRDVRTGLTVPPKLTFRTLLDMATQRRDLLRPSEIRPVGSQTAADRTRRARRSPTGP